MDRKKVCGNCAFFVASSVAAKGNCAFNPPSVQFMPVELPPQSAVAIPGKKSRFDAPEVQSGGMGYAPFSAQPMVPATGFCHNHTDETATTG